MKGVIVKCLEELVTTQFGTKKWEAVLAEAGLRRDKSFLTISDVADETVLRLVGATCNVLHLTEKQAAEAFGDYWVNQFAPKMYKFHFSRCKTARDFLLGIDEIHVTMTKSMPNATPPRFKYEWEGDNTLVMHYTSARGLTDFAVGLVKGVGKYYKEALQVVKLSSDKIRIVFA